jgi:hypothetical protein
MRIFRLWYKLRLNVALVTLFGFTATDIIERFLVVRFPDDGQVKLTGGASRRCAMSVASCFFSSLRAQSHKQKPIVMAITISHTNMSPLPEF